MADPFYEPLPTQGQTPWSLSGPIQEIRERISDVDNFIASDGIEQAIAAAAATLTPEPLSDAFIAGRINTSGSDTEVALRDRPVVLPYVGGAYPTRVPNVTNIFFGGPDPGLLMGSEDVWIPPDDTILPTVASAILTGGSAVNQAVRRVAVDTVDLQIAASGIVSPLAVTVGTSPNQVYGYALVKDPVNNNGVRFNGLVPADWTRARLHAIWMHDTGSGQIRIARGFRQYDSTGIVASGSITTNNTSSGTMKAQDASYEFDVVGGKLISGSIARVAGVDDTLDATVIIPFAWLERVT